MIGDFSRNRTAHAQGFRQVLLQQGRVLLDADFNEQGTIAAHVLRRLTADLLGPHAGPAGDLGFAIGLDDDGRGFTIGSGRYYVHGLMIDQDSDGPVRFDDQEGRRGADALKSGVPYFLYLDAWERTVSWLEDDAIREVALGGPDTAIRRQVVWQVRAIERPLPAKDFQDEGQASAWLAAKAERRPATAGGDPGLYLPLMRAFVDPEDDPDETPCVADPLGGYRGMENQLYRVQIHSAPDLAPGEEGGGLVTFKWSRENGSVAAAWTGLVGDTLIVEGVRDTAHGFAAGQWVEIADRSAELRGAPGVMVHLTKVERDHLTFDPATASAPLPAIDALTHPIVRRWDHAARDGVELAGGAIILEQDRDYPLEHGLKVRFAKKDPDDQGRQVCVTGDWWGFAARVATADIDWPSTTQMVDGRAQKTYLDRTPDGAEHVYAPLAVGTLGSSAKVTSLQRQINPLSSPV
jgi:hypothetical protein